MKLYLVFFALSLVLYSIHWPTAIYDVRTFTAANPTGWLSRFLDELANTRGMSASQFAQEVNSRWQSYISMSQVVYPLFVALTLKLLFRRRGLYFAEHLIFALHVLAFTLPHLRAPLAGLRPVRSSNLDRNLYGSLCSDHGGLDRVDRRLLAPCDAPRLRRTLASRGHQKRRRLFDLLPDLNGF